MKIVGAMALALVLAATSGQSHAKKEPPLTDDERNVVQVYEAPGFTKEEIQSGAKRWIAENFRSADAVIEYEDAGTIIGNGNLVIDPPMQRGVSYYSVYRGRVGFKMKVEAKDGRLRVSFTSIRLLYRGTGDTPPERRHDMENIRAKLLEFGPLIVASLAETKNSDDW